MAMVINNDSLQVEAYCEEENAWIEGAIIDYSDSHGSRIFTVYLYHPAL
jgi:hypothetical protein